MTGGTRPLVLAIAPSPRGFAFALCHEPSAPIDWGIKDIRGERKNARCVAEVKKLLRRYGPEVVVLPADDGSAPKRGPRIRTLLRLIETLALREHASVRRYSRRDVRTTFEHQAARTRPEISRVIAAAIPAFAPKLPPPRKIWQSEDPRQSLFDALALVLTHDARASRVEDPRL
jgi:hypothetical protein